MRQDDLPTHGGRTLAYVYDSGLAEADAIGREALAAYGSTNALDPTAFPSLLRMEQDLIADAAALLRRPAGDRRHRHLRRHRVDPAGGAGAPATPDPRSPGRPWCCPRSAHGAFHKAAHYFGVRPVFVEVDPETGRAVASAMTAAITDDTVLVVASAPSYAHGVIDPVTQIATAAQAAASAATSTRASAAGCCPTCAATTPSCRRSRSWCPG